MQDIWKFHQNCASRSNSAKYVSHQGSRFLNAKTIQLDYEVDKISLDGEVTSDASQAELRCRVHIRSDMLMLSVDGAVSLLTAKNATYQRLSNYISCLSNRSPE